MKFPTEEAGRLLKHSVIDLDAAVEACRTDDLAKVAQILGPLVAQLAIIGAAAATAAGLTEPCGDPDCALHGTDSDSLDLLNPPSDDEVTEGIDEVQSWLASQPRTFTVDGNGQAEEDPGS